MFGCSPLMMGKTLFDPSTPLGTATQGGYFLGTLSIGGTSYALIVAPRATGDLDRRWRNGSTANSPGTASTTDGLANTDAAATIDSSHHAAIFCRNLVTGGFSDWYMPAQDELNVLYINRASLPSGEEFYTSSATGAPYYWASTQDPGDTGRGMFQDFSSGSQASSTKVNNFRVRAIRRIATE